MAPRGRRNRRRTGWRAAAGARSYRRSVVPFGRLPEKRCLGLRSGMCLRGRVCAGEHCETQGVRTSTVRLRVCRRAL